MMVHVVHRLLAMIPVLLGVSVIVFLLVHLMPGDPAAAVAGEKAPPEVVERVRREYGFDRPLSEQYLRYIGGIVLHGDFQRSFRTRRPIVEDIKTYFPATLELSGAAMLVALIAGMGLGILASRRPGSWADQGSMALALVGVSFPVFFLGMLLLLLFAGWLPGGQRLASWEEVPVCTHFLLLDTLLAGDLRLFGSALAHLFLPAVTLATVPMAVIARMTRSGCLEEAGSDYVRTARAKGVGEFRIVFGHILRNALIPVLTSAGMQFGYLMAGAVLTETIFQWQGIGWYVVDAVSKRDVVALQGGVLVIAAAFVTVNLLVDLAYAWIDPRVSHG